MSVTVDLPSATLRRLEAEAARRGVRIEVVIAELAEALPEATEPAPGHRFAFEGVAASGDGTLSERYKAIRRDEFGS
jgi:diacylglycerol kinase family enzyme